jgi:hypothetical protein
MVVDQYNRGGGEFEGALDHLARIDRRMIDGTRLLHLVGDKGILLVEEQHAELLACLERHRRAAILDHRRPGCENLTVLEFALEHAVGDCSGQLEFGCDAVSHALDFSKQVRWCAEHFGQGAEPGQQRLGDRLGVAARDQPEQQQLEQFIIGKRPVAALAEALAQPVAMSVKMFARRRRGSTGCRSNRLAAGLALTAFGEIGALVLRRVFGRSAVTALIVQAVCLQSLLLQTWATA